MPRTRTTRDTFELWTNYGHGWDHETTEWTREAGRAQVQCYAENCPQANTRLILRRVKLATMTEEERAEAAQADAAVVEARKARQARRLAARLAARPTCKHCGRSLRLDSVRGWIDPDAPTGLVCGGPEGGIHEPVTANTTPHAAPD